MSSRKCKPGCTCGRHKAQHKPNCQCTYHKPRLRLVKDDDKQPQRNDRCKCGHLALNHDIFGCRTCQMDRSNRHERIANPCTRFRSRYGGYYIADNIDYAAEVAKQGFIRHIDDLATCTECWHTVKLGKAHTLTSLINARAHKQICSKEVRAEMKQRRPEPGREVG